MNRPTVISLGMIFFLLFSLTPFASGQVLPEDPTRGGTLFASKGCAKCHAIKGEGGKLGPDLSKVDFGDSQLNLATRLWNHAPVMITEMQGTGLTKPSLTGLELGEISSYLYFLKFYDEPGNSARGRSVFEEKGCRLCHPLTGMGREGKPGVEKFPRNISPVFLSRAIWNHCLEMIAQMVEIGMKWPKFFEKEMIDLLEYIKVYAKGAEDPAFFNPGSPKQGREVFLSKGCIQCHSIRGEGAKGGVDLGKTSETFYTSLTQIASSMWNKGPTVIVKIAQTQCGIPRFTSKEMSDLLSYLYFLHFADRPGNRATGEKVFSEMGCSQCHGPERKSGKLMYIDLSRYQNRADMEIVAGLWNHGMEMQKATGERGMPWPQLKEGTLADLLEYIRAPRNR